MAADAGASGAVGLSIKSGLAAGAIALTVSVLAVMVGFTIVPLQRGNEARDAARRLAAGLFCSCTLGAWAAAKAISVFPWLLNPWLKIFSDGPLLWPYLAAGLPFAALTALPGFWLVGAFVRWFERRANRDIGELIGDVRGQLAGRQKDMP